MDEASKEVRGIVVLQELVKAVGVHVHLDIEVGKVAVDDMESVQEPVAVPWLGVRAFRFLASAGRGCPGWGPRMVKSLGVVGG